MANLMGNDPGFIDTLVKAFRAVQEENPEKMNVSLPAILGALGGSAYGNLIKPGIEAVDYLGGEINRTARQPLNEYDSAPIDPQKTLEAMTEVGLLGTIGSGLMGPKPSNVLSTFGGQGAKNADQAALKIAQDGGLMKSIYPEYLPPGSPERQANFDQWFGGSKIVDDQGQPLQLYHGTDKDFDFFDPEKVNERFPFSFGLHTTNSPEEASIYADSVNNAAEKWNYKSRFSKPVREGAAVYPVNVKSENPLIIDTNFSMASMEADENRNEIIRKIVESRRAGTPFDSVWIRGKDGNYNVIPFESNQIKSVFNRGTYNEFDPNILKAGLMGIPRNQNDEEKH